VVTLVVGSAALWRVFRCIHERGVLGSRSARRGAALEAVTMAIIRTS
jgi:hypothetical protein